MGGLNKINYSKFAIYFKSDIIIDVEQFSCNPCYILNKLIKIAIKTINIVYQNFM